jgi:hypothetical protein
MGTYGDVPNSIHQMYVLGDTMYVSYYTQGLRVLDVTNPASPVEIGYYDDIPTMDTVLNSSRLFRLSNVNANGYPNAFQGLWGVVPDVNHPGIIYGSGSEGLNVYGLYSRTLSGTVSSNTTLSGVVNVTGNVTVNSGATLTINPGTVLAFSSGFTLTVNGVLHAVGTGTQPITFT